MAVLSALFNDPIEGTYSLVGEGIPGNTLSLHTPHESDVGSEDGDPSEGSENGDGGCKVIKDL